MSKCGILDETKQRGEQRKIHWKKWGTLRQPQECRGMGFKDLVKFSEAMLAKQV